MRFLRLLTFLIFSTSFVTLFAQDEKPVTLTGQVLDSLEGGLATATVVLLNPADSVIVSFAITNGEGTFSLRRVPPGDYLI
ncbi:MAG: carboxypeptidase regulatory-like domain-containing protein, partial [Saprospiraceae bacterium]|nr:carboxypeptidase regulatory-like domain-containing protein [Saprospiraceae bacterium]